MSEDAIQAETSYFMERLRESQSLALKKRRVSDQDAFGLAKALEKNATLTLLSLRSDGIGPVGMRALTEVLRYNEHISDIILFGHNGDGDERADAVSDVIKDSRKLSKLHLTNFGICRVGAAFIGEALKRNSVLQELSLENNAIGSDGAAAIGDALKMNHILTEINLSGNGIGDEGCGPIADALVVNKSLRTLYLQHNRIRDAGAGLLANALRINRSLKRLGLGANKGISLEGSHALAKGLQDNSVLEWLNGVDLRPYSFEVFGIPKIRESSFSGHNFDNVELLEMAREIRERTRKRYAELTNVYRTKSTGRNAQRLFTSSSQQCLRANKQGDMSGRKVQRLDRLPPNTPSCGDGMPEALEKYRKKK